MAGMASVAFARFGPDWPKMCGLVSGPVATAGLPMYFQPLCTDTHWALLAVRKLFADHYEYALVDALPSPMMKQRAVEACSKLGHSGHIYFASPFEQHQRWECGPIAADMMAQITAVPVTRSVVAMDLVRKPLDVVLRELEEAHAAAARFYGGGGGRKPDEANADGGGDAHEPDDVGGRGVCADAGVSEAETEDGPADEANADGGGDAHEPG